MKEYIMNVRALEICLALHEEQYEKVLAYAEEFKKGEAVSSKIRRRISSAEITAYQVTPNLRRKYTNLRMRCG
jgi:hypothetical protein